MKRFIILSAVFFLTATAYAGDYLGDFTVNPYNPNRAASPGYASPYSAPQVRQSYGNAATPFTSNAPKLYNSSGQYRGNLSNSKIDPNSISNPVGRYGSTVSPDSINNPLNKFKADSPFNPYGNGLKIFDK